MDIEQVEALERIAELKRRGLLDDHEVEEAKREILGRAPATSSELPATESSRHHLDAATSKRALLVIGAIGIVVVIVALVLRDTDDKTSLPVSTEQSSEESSEPQQKLKTPQDVLGLTETQIRGIADRNGIDLSDPALDSVDLTKQLAKEMIPSAEWIDEIFQFLVDNHVCQIQWMWTQGLKGNYDAPLPTFNFEGDYPTTSAGLQLRAAERLCERSSLSRNEIIRLHNEGDSDLSFMDETGLNLRDALREEGYLGAESTHQLMNLLPATISYMTTGAVAQSSLPAPWVDLGIAAYIMPLGPNGSAFNSGKLFAGLENVLYSNPYLEESFDQLVMQFEIAARNMYNLALSTWLASKGTHLVSIDVARLGTDSTEFWQWPEKSTMGV